jgi:imidazolonepropionase-like amidohydrolase
MRPLLVLSLLLLPRSGAGQAPARDTTPVVIRDVTVIDVERGRRVPARTVVLRGGRIDRVEAGDLTRIPPDARVIDGHGRYLIPGLVDTHVHVWWGAGATPDTLSILRWLLANGVTGIREASGAGREEELVALRGRVERGETVAPRFYVSGTASMRNVERYKARDLRDLVQRLAAFHVDGIKVIHLTRDEAVAAIAAADDVGLPVYGHAHVVGGPGMQRPDLPFGFTGYAMDAVRAGLTGMMHVTSATPTPEWAQDSPPASLTREARAAAVDEWMTRMYEGWLSRSAADEQALLDSMIARHVWLEPTLITEDVFAHPARYMPHSGEAQHGTNVREWWGVRDDSVLMRRRRAVMARLESFVRRYHAKGGLLTTGTDLAPLPGFGVHDELALLVDAGLTPTAALQAATINAARVFGWSDRTGSVARGKLADLVLLDADPLADIRNTTKIRAVVANGRMLMREALDSMLVVRR